MAESVNIWVKTSTLESILNGGSPSKSRNHRSSMTTSDYDEDGTVNWGWVPATVISGGQCSASNGQLDATEAITVMVNDEESEYHRAEVEIPGGEIEVGNVVMANFHAEDDEDAYGESGGSGFDGEDSGYPDDLITLTHLHEPAVVHCLRKRYERDKIYTSTGPILIALNPFKSCKQLYSDSIMRQYWKRGEENMLMGGSVGGRSGGGGDDDEDNAGRYDEELPPHVYALADATYRSMMLKLDMESSSSSGGRGGRSSSSASPGCDQSILVSGESGAGKTVTTKFIMQYLATLSQRCAEAKEGNATNTPRSKRPVVKKDGSLNNVNIEQQVLQSNPILESFGNARTVRNDNSSRFGKFIEIRFNKSGTLIGASIETYLLEKVRLISQSEGERNYHVFYEMLVGMNDEEIDQFLLTDYTAEDFKMTSCSGTFDRRDGVQDVDTYVELRDALEVMGFTPEQQNDLFSIASAVLHLSNLTINSIKGGEESEIDHDNPHLEPILQLLGVTKDNLNQALCYFKIEARGQSYTRAVQKDKADKGVEALIKATYSAMFDYIVKSINESITVKKTATSKPGAGGRSSTDKGNAVIGVLDIFGFESFKVNSFEQLCINYCNEALQQQFNLFVLKNEQDEYEREGIKWSFISFPDNQDVLDLIWKKGFGILNILDDQCRAPGTTDKTFANDIYQKLTGKPRFEANFRQVGARQFGVFHYAGLVEYDTDGFVEKNRDELPREATELLLSSSSGFVKELAAIISSSAAPEPTKGARAGPKKSVTVGGHFSKQLSELRAKIDLTSPHYVRCLKPNGALIPDHFDPLMIVDQLRCAGVVEAVRVSRVGYPQRYNHAQFVARYKNLALKELAKAAKGSRKMKPVDTLVDAIAKKMVEIDPSLAAPTVSKSKSDSKVDLIEVGIQVGKTKVFLRRRAFDILENMRKVYIATATVKIQAIARGFIQQRTFREYCSSSLQLQCWVRVIIAERKVQAVRELVNARKIQNAYRRYSGRKYYLCVLSVTRWCQRLHRGAVGRARYDILNRVRKAIIIQKFWRGIPYRRRYQQMKSSIIVIQCSIRQKLARSHLKELKVNAKNLQNVAQERDKLRQQMEAMRLEVERAKLLAKKEAEEAAKIKAVSNATSKSEFFSLQQEVERLKKELSETQTELKSEQESARSARAEVETKANEAREAREMATALDKKLEESTANVSAIFEELSTFKRKFEEALSESRAKDEEIWTLKSELANISTETASNAEFADLEQRHNEVLEQSSKKDDEIQRLKNELDSNLSYSTCENREVVVLRRQLETMKSESNDKANELNSLKEELSRISTTPKNGDEKEALTSLLNKLTSEAHEKDDAIKKLQSKLKNTVGQTSSQPTAVANGQHDELQNQLAELRHQLHIANKKLAGARESPQLAEGDLTGPTIPLSQYEELRNELESLKSERELARDSSSVVEKERVHTKPDRDLKKENSKMKKEIAKLKEANKKILETAEQQLESLSAFESENAELRNEIDNMREAGIMGIAASATSNAEEIAQWKKLLQAQTDRAEAAIARQAELEAQVSKLLLKHGNGSRAMLNQSIKEEGESDDDEDSKLEDAKAALHNNPDDGKLRLFDKNEQLKLMADSVDQKNFEIETLKTRIRTQEAELESLREEDLTFGSRDNNAVEDNAHFEMTAAANESLKTLNTELSKQLDLYLKEAHDAKKKLREERKRADLEMKAFSVALKGVDDLRGAAERMSRELHFIKKNGYVPPGGLTGLDTSQNVKNAMSAIETMAIANQTVDNPNEEKPPLRRGFSLWNAMNAVMAPTGRLSAEANDESCDDSVIMESTVRLKHPSSEIGERRRSGEREKKSGSGKKRKKKRGDGGSVISSFF
ncbi:hypothetical protein ACHAXS_014162 [Conticribra weissflogii]